MKKYNLSEIMTRAWSIRRDANCTMSVALTQSWAIAKAPKAEKKMSNMIITISDRYMTDAQYKACHGIPYISCSNAYNHKDTLKAMGYKFNPTNKSWEIKINPAHFMDLCAETAIACELSVRELESFLEAIGDFQQSPRSNGFCNDFTVDGLDDRYNSYCDKIGF